MENKKLIFDDIKCRLDRQAIQEFHTQWQLQLAITTEELMDRIALQITRIIRDKEMDADTWITFGENDKYEIDLSLDRTSGECWMYPTAYGLKLEEHVVMILRSKCASPLFDKSKVSHLAIDAFAKIYQIRDAIDADTIIGWIEDDLSSHFDWPEDTWHEHTFTTPEHSNEPQHIDFQYYTGEDGARYIDIYPVLYNNTLLDSCHGIYKDGGEDGQ